jgi:hypothetical protein
MAVQHHRCHDSGIQKLQELGTPEVGFVHFRFVTLDLINKENPNKTNKNQNIGYCNLQ